jgi:hypothetical protein
VFGLVCVVAAAALLSQRQPSYGREAAAPDAATNLEARVAAPIEKARPTAPMPRSPQPATPEPDPIEEPSIAIASKHESTAAPESTAIAAGLSSATITGCLERDGEGFRLEEPTGANAPMARSWKSGFLRKRPASVEVVDHKDRLRLDKHVGHRVAIGGSLDGRELHARSIALAEGVCN